MQGIEERLRSLSSAQAEPGGVPDADRLWRTGRRRHARRTAAAAAGVVALTCAVVVGAGAAFPRGSGVDGRQGEGLFATERGEATGFRLPQRMAVPDEADLEELPAGPVAALLTEVDEQPYGPVGTLPGETGGVGGSGPVVAVSAETGQYGLLTLPEGAAGVELSPGGTKVLYWLSDPDVADSADVAWKGWTSAHVRDLASGEVSDIEVDTATSVDALSVQWLDDDTLVASLTQRFEMDGPEFSFGSKPMDPLLWRTGSEAWSVWPQAAGAVPTPNDTVGAGGVPAFGEAGWWLLDPTTSALRQGAAASTSVTSTTVPELDVTAGDHLQIAVSGDGRWLLAYSRVLTNGPTNPADQQEELRALDLSDPQARWREVPMEQSIVTLGVGRGGEVVVIAAESLDFSSGVGEPAGWQRYMTLDPETGDVADLIADDTLTGTPQRAWSYARSVLGAAHVGEVG